MENKLENLEKKENLLYQLIDKNSLKLPSIITYTGDEKAPELIFDSIHQEDFGEKYLLMNSKDDIREINEECMNIVSMSYNSHILFFVKNNGECNITDGHSNNSEINLNINNKILAEYSHLTLKNSLKLTGSLNKKYLIKVACGTNHAILLTHAGMVFSLGKGEYGQLGHGDTKDSEEPQMITSLLNFRIFEISVGGFHNLALGSMRDLGRKSNSSLSTLENKKEQIFLYSWGDNSKGQIGQGKNIQLSNYPKLIEFFTNKNFTIKRISSGIDHSLILTDNGKLFGFGSNSHFQLGFENPKDEESSSNCLYEPCRIRYKSCENSEIKMKHKFFYVKCSSYSSLLVTDRNIVIIYGNNYRENDVIFSRNIILKEKKSNKNVNLQEIVNYESGSDQEINFIIKNEKLIILYDKMKFDLSLEKQVEFSLESPIPTEENIVRKIKENFHIRLHTNSNELEGENINSYTQETPDDTGFLHDFEISKEFFSDNASTNELFDNNLSFEQSIEELRNYISLVGISFVGDPGNSSLSFRPKNLPKKTEQEEYYHRKLVEENRKRYIKFLKEKQEEERKIKEKQDKKKLKLKKLQEVWENEILPNWFKKKRDYNYIKKYFYEGIPTSLRGRVWLLCIGNNFSITPEYYEIEVKKAVNILQQLQNSEMQARNEVSNKNNITNTSNNVNNLPDSSEKTMTTTPNNKYNIKIIDKEKSIKYIDLDIERTFPYLGIFKGSSPLGEDLREILQVFVASRPDIGYVQGLSFIAGMLLLYMDKYQAFVALMNITLSHNIIPFYRFEENQIRKRLQIFKQIFYFNLPELCDHFESLDILPEHYLIEWCMTIFTKNLNIDVSARIWDIYMIEGVKAIYQSAIVILSHFEKKFYNMEFDAILRTLKNTNSINFDEDQLLEMMKQVKFPEWVNQEIQKLNDENIPIY